MERTSKVDCVFCGIVAGSVPATLLHQDERCVAFHDRNPAAPLHVLVVPREHIDSLAEATDEALTGHLFHVAARIHLLAGRRLSWPPG